MKKYYSAVCLLMLLTVSCGPSLKVSSDSDKSVNFQQYKTFSLYTNDSSSGAISPLNKQRLENAVLSEMQKKGFTVNNSNPDLLVNTVTILKDKVAVSSTTDYYGYGGIYRPYYWGAGSMYSNTTYNVDHYKDGSVLIDIIDAGSKKLIWQGTGNSEIDGPLKDPDTQIPAAVAKIMADFPPGVPKKS